ncbi:uncharacterized protein HKW66_Vig0099030 [Vigna angularis]|uniref:CCDC93 coiled-coil domain-containing protein n=1 Tax=Phaseolus angularis TaxID=3914 RepID=A0A8T0KPH9_PHAAN|nr:uncharacterized protein HKW66_Vig0099030 [Vigna angularis]
MDDEGSNSSTIQKILDLLYTAGFVHATDSDASPSEKVAAGLSWCIAAITQDKTLGIDESLELVGCPHRLRLSHVQDLDADALFPVIQWLTSHLPQNQEHRASEVSHAENTVAADESKTSIEALSGNLDELVGEIDKMLDMKLTLSFASMPCINLFGFAIGWACYFGLKNQQKMNVVKQLTTLQERINNEGADSAAQKLISLMTSLKDLEKQDNYFQSNRDSKHSELQADISELERQITNYSDNRNLSDGLHNSFSELVEKVDLMKKQLAARLRNIVALRRQIDDLPCQSEVIQYECRLSELYMKIQGKHRQTHKYYATYNALLEIKELMLKEASLLNSIISQHLPDVVGLPLFCGTISNIIFCCHSVNSLTVPCSLLHIVLHFHSFHEMLSQFQEAFSSTDGRIKLVHSMEGIVKGSQQKLEKVHVGLQEEERIRNDLKGRYAAAVGERKRCYYLSKAFQVSFSGHPMARLFGDFCVLILRCVP